MFKLNKASSPDITAKKGLIVREEAKGVQKFKIEAQKMRARKDSSSSSSSNSSSKRNKPKKSKKKNDSSSFGSDSSSVQSKSEKADTVKPLVEESSQNIGAAERQNRL